ncbi:hypothetical protein Taro_019849 [Colocasia esculenta]|uniref:SHSP domain-containing protein n=1 Tax=Colocasia esculenta TaxID=4460 RepID=A0A843UXX6_COLES|nr:hypothetical protein [Colocasia esculenta]
MPFWWFVALLVCPFSRPHTSFLSSSSSSLATMFAGLLIPVQLFPVKSDFLWRPCVTFGPVWMSVKRCSRLRRPILLVKPVGTAPAAGDVFPLFSPDWGRWTSKMLVVELHPYTISMLGRLRIPYCFLPLVLSLSDVGEDVGVLLLPYFCLQSFSFPFIARMSLIPSFFGNRRTSVSDPFSLDVWEPFQDFPFRGWDSETPAFAAACVDWKETPEAHVFKADLPGVNKEEMKVEVEDGRILQISGQRSKEKEEKTDTWHRVERNSGRFVRRFQLLENAQVDQVKASMENGVLTVTVPKEEAKKQPEVKAIEISG